jgi:transposase InsO family protein
MSSRSSETLFDFFNSLLEEPRMKRGHKTSAEQAVLKLGRIEVQTTQGKSLALACKEAEISEQSYRDECLRQEISYSLKEAQIVIALSQTTYNRARPHSSFGYRPPAPVTLPDLAFQLPMAATMQ